MSGSLRSGKDLFGDGPMDYYSRTTQVPNALFDQWMRDLTLAELKLLLLVVRMTRGWVVHPSGLRRSRDWLSCSRIMALTGLSDRAITTATGSLIARGLLVVTDARGSLLAAPHERRGRTRLYYGLAMDHGLGPKEVRWRSENTSAEAPKPMRITKPNLTKPSHQSRAEAHAPRAWQGGTHYRGSLQGALAGAMAPGLWERLKRSMHEKNPRVGAAKEGRVVASSGAELDPG